MVAYELILPPGFDEYAWEVESKGWLGGVVVIFEKARYTLNFYDPVRLAQEVADELSGSDVFVESNLLVIERVDRIHIEKAVEYLAGSSGFGFLKCDE